MEEYILEMKDIVRTFPGVRALNGVDFRAKRGVVHALMGENGAGKSTLMKCLVGINPPDSGEIWLKGKKVQIQNPNEALKLGIAMIYQELNPVAERSVMENIWLGREPMLSKLPLFVDHKEMYKKTKELLENLEINIEPKVKVKELSVAKMQMIEIAKAISYNADIVIMDEPTSSLTPNEVEHLFSMIQKLKDRGVAVIYITHKMEEIFNIADEVTVLRDGNHILTKPISEMTIDSLITAMVGRYLTDMFPKMQSQIGDVKLSVRHLEVPGLLHDISFDVRKGEILGVAGLVGAGRTELMETLFGLRRKSSGEIFIDGEKVEIRSPSDAINTGIGFLTEDRRLNGIIPVLSVQMNIILANIKNYSKLKIFLDLKTMQNDCEKYKERLKIRTPSLEALIQNLSGGNQQKVLVARWLLTNPDILILDEPTRGIDVGAKAEIHTIITKLACEGKSIIMVSSEMPEILGMSDRILVMSHGQITAILDRKDANQEIIMRYAAAKTNAAIVA
ncbi:MAG TPA: sugar ABC transporter ATP-binding protein [Rectinema sp.]|jgi:ABC-type sugar transport system ATPase subunit|nr:D-xylose ABC transporter ATP-binding protein [Spirochaetaceae bacterium]HNV19269.1 sugar ABC transporter ATP-binding protein [Rectinema sp.]HNZ93982.1 sugar ABC transporter ATP-binding protein [Rectinema sp.]HOD58761.1 sugar ABC transporter ATP-binding protein [Rectinema sp.]HOH17465.1 sugar ABC transporter ATP-binding protein [Rectinema sp.]